MCCISILLQSRIVGGYSLKDLIEPSIVNGDHEENSVHIAVYCIAPPEDWTAKKMYTRKPKHKSKSHPGGIRT